MSDLRLVVTWVNVRLGLVRRLIGSLKTDQAPQSIGKRSERKSDSHVKSSLSFCLALFKERFLIITFFLTFIAGPRFLEFYGNGWLQVIRFKRHVRAFVSGHMWSRSQWRVWALRYTGVNSKWYPGRIGCAKSKHDIQQEGRTCFPSQECKDRYIGVEVSSPPFRQSGWRQSTTFGSDWWVVCFSCSRLGNGISSSEV